MSSTKRLVLLAVTIFLIGRYYEWMSRATGGKFLEVADLNGYYNMLSRALLKGQLHLEMAPPPEMLALANPWDPQQNFNYRLHDAVLFEGRYYIYHGVVPAVLLFAPWRALFGFDLPQHFGLFLLLFAVFLFWLGAVGRVAGLRRTGVFTAIALGLSTGAPYLLNRIDVYEIAIGGGFLCGGAGVFFLAGRQYLLAGLCFGLAVGCRPHLGLVGSLGFVWLCFERRSVRDSVRFAAPFAAAIAVLCWYNYARFGNPLEFGMRHMLAGELSHQKLNLSLAHFRPSAYYYFWSPPDFGPVFPWVRAVMRLPEWLRFPKGYFLEGTVGLLFFAPVSFLAVRARGLAGFMALAGAGLLVFHLATGFTTQRYFIDFVPLLVFAAAVAMPGKLFALLAVAGAVVNLLLAIAGPWNEYLKKRPESYLRLARTFSPSPRLRPVANPPLDVTIHATGVEMPDGIQEPLLSVGLNARRYVLFIEHRGGKLRLMSAADESTQTIAEGLPETAPMTVRVTSEPEIVRVSVNGAPPMEHKVGMLVSAAVQIAVGVNDPFNYPIQPRFYGSISQTASQTPR